MSEDNLEVHIYVFLSMSNYPLDLFSTITTIKSTNVTKRLKKVMNKKIIF